MKIFSVPVNGMTGKRLFSLSSSFSKTNNVKRMSEIERIFSMQWLRIFIPIDENNQNGLRRMETDTIGQKK